MRKRWLLHVYLIIFLFSIVTVCYFINSYRRSHASYQADNIYEFHDFYFLNEEDSWLVGDSGLVFITHDGGKSWEKHNTTITADLIKVQFVSKQVGWILGGGEIYKTNDGGLNWTNQGDNLDFISNFCFMNETTGWIIIQATPRELLITRDGGKQWSSQISFINFKPPLWSALEDVYFLNESHGWLLYRWGVYGSNSSTVILHTNNSGEAWEPYSTIINTSVTEFYFKDHLNGWVFGLLGDLFHSNDSGRTWINQDSFTEEPLEDMFFLTNYTGWICGANSTILHTQDGGKVWITLSNPSLQVDYRAIIFQSENLGFAIGTSPELFISYDGGNTWLTSQVDMFTFNNSWILILMVLDTLFIILGTYLYSKSDQIKNSKVGHHIKNFLIKSEGAFFNLRTKKSGLFSLSFILLLIYVFEFIFNFVHEVGHAFATLVLGGYTDHIEMSWGTAGRTFTLGNFTNFDRIVISMAGFLSQLTLAIVVIAILLFYFKRYKFPSFLAILTFIISILSGFFYYIIIQMDPSPLGGASDITHIAQRLNVPPSVICLFFLPHFIISVYIGGRLGVFFYKTHLNSKKKFLYLFLISFLILYIVINLIFYPFTVDYDINFY